MQPLGSGRPGRPARGQGAPLTKARIVEEALTLVDAEGADELTMRKLARRLGVEAMSLYSHVASKNDLLNAVADRVASELSIPATPHEKWRERIRSAVTTWARMQEVHPGGFPLLYRSRTATANERAVTEEIMDALATAGFDSAEVALTYHTLVSFLDGALLNRPPAWQVRRGQRQSADRSDPALYPRTAESSVFAVQLIWADVFYRGLDLFLFGLEGARAARFRQKS